jgi:Macrocin-O-methyltransferase (TylF)
MQVSSKKRFKEFAKRLAFRYTNLGAPAYPYNLEPIQLATLVFELDRLQDVRGTIVEVGVARGMTTRFLCEHLVKSKATQDRFAVVDTFSSFKPDHLQYEVTQRGKSRNDMEAFGFNDFEVWKNNFAEFPFVIAYQADCAEFDYSQIAPIKLALLDVDLYLPTKAALGKIYNELAPGGVILVDDVATNSTWDGAYQAYHEFCAENSLTPRRIGNKCGAVTK